MEAYTALPSGLVMVEATPPAAAEVKLKEVEKGIFLVGASGTCAMFVEMDDLNTAIARQAVKVASLDSR